MADQKHITVPELRKIVQRELDAEPLCFDLSIYQIFQMEEGWTAGISGLTPKHPAVGFIRDMLIRLQAEYYTGPLRQ